MDWDTPFNVLIMEDNKDHDKIATLLVSKGYEYIRRQRGNVIWALRSFRPKIQNDNGVCGLGYERIVDTCRACATGKFRGSNLTRLCSECPLDTFQVS